MTKTIKTGIIGFGLSGKVFHAPFIHIHQGFELKKVVERHDKKSKNIYPYVEVVNDYQNLIKDPEIDLIIHATPNIYHYEYVKECLLAGKHVVIEKPFTPTSQEADELIQLAESKNLKIFVYQNRRWDGDFLTIQKIKNEGLLGDIQYFEAHFDRYSPERKRAAWRDKELPGSGNLFDLGSHLIDQVLCLFGQPDTLKADIQSQRNNSPVDDYFKIDFQYPRLQAIIKAGMLVKEQGPRYIIHGSRGSFIKYGIDPQEGSLQKGMMPDAKNFGKEDPSFYGQVTIDDEELNCTKEIITETGNYIAFYQNVYDVLIKGKEMIIKPEEARNVIKTIEIAFQSAQSKNTIKVNF